jgi:oxygen-independent coproporphyrinogen-3 oxidase
MTADTAAGPRALELDEFSSLEISEALIRRFDKTGPRYTSYPTADRLQAGFPAARYQELLRQRAADPAPLPLSVYVHLPFCESLCYFCACNKIITRDHGAAASYLEVLHTEIGLVGAELGAHRETRQLHLGGGTPTFLSEEELTALMQHLRAQFHFTADAELGIEIDPRTVTPDMLRMLAGLGFNRTSFGVQDFNPEVQQAVNRIQPYEMVRTALQASRDNGFESINADLIYGLPKQTVASFSHTLDQIIELAPDRIALYNYAHLPERFKGQRLIRAADLPSAETKLQIFLMSLRRLLEAGYVYIGLDHFAKPDDALNRARLDHTLHRNFQGYTTCADTDLVGLGISAIGKIGDSYVQNQHMRKPWAEAIMDGQFAISKGFDLSHDDVMRRELIMAIMCGVPINFAAFGARHGIDFTAHFDKELEQLDSYAEAGLIELDEAGLRVLPKGRFFVRAVGMVFDDYLGRPRTATYSKLI